ncbi:MAG: DUF563 domain-containing protein [Helicobacteraceae bacterium]|nr:DUF563 domain-containing protein [Helicobacteraceae bacterium]
MKKELLLKNSSSDRIAPMNLTEADEKLFGHELSSMQNDVYMYSFKNMTIKFPLFYENNTYNSVIASYVYKDISRAKLTVARVAKKLRKFTFKKERLKGKYLWITDTLSNGYFHWLADVLPKLVMLKEEYKSKVLLQSKYKEFSYVEKSLNYLGYEVHYFNEVDSVEVEELLFIPNIANSGSYYEDSMNLLREEFYKYFKFNVSKCKNEKVYISRAKATRRKIKNEEEIETILKKYEFNIYYFEELSFEEQVKLMLNTSHLISLHGAGLTNMLFMPSNSKVLEIRSQEDDHNNCYFALTSAMDHNYYYTLAKNETNNFHSGDVIVDLEKFEKAIRYILL